MALPMDDPCTADAPVAALGEELGEQGTRMLDPETMQIDLEPDLDRASLELGEHPPLNPRTGEEEVVPGLDLGLREFGLGLLLWKLRRARPRDGWRLASIRLGAIMRQPLGILDLLAEEFQVLLLDWRLHRFPECLSAERFRSIIPRVGSAAIGAAGVRRGQGAGTILIWV